MKKLFIYFLIVGVSSLLAACGGKFHAYNFSEEYATSLHYEGMSGEDKKEVEEQSEGDLLVGIPARSFYGGDLKRGAIWWAGKGITLEKGDVFTITFTEVGPDSIPFGATFPPIDLIKEEVALKVSMRAAGSDSTGTAAPAPTIYLQADDASGNQANAKRPFNTVENSGEFKDYYFDLRGIYLQDKPTKRKVNGAMINSLKFFINPGQSAYTGTIYIKEIKVVPAGSIVK